MLNIFFGALHCIIGGMCVWQGVKKIREGKKEIEDTKLLEKEKLEPENFDESGLPEKI